MFADAAVVLEFPIHAWRERFVTMKPWMKEVFFGVLAVSILGVVISNGRDLGKLEGRIEVSTGLIATNAERTKNIANVLRDLGVRLAWESIYTPFPAAVLVTNTPMQESGKWKISMTVLDTQKGRLTAYKANLHSRDDLGLVLMFGGSIKVLDKRAVSIEEMEAFAKETKSPLIGPSYINKKVSYIVYKDPRAVNLHLMNLGYAKTGGRKVPKADMWPELVKGIKEKKFFKGRPPPPPAP